MVEHLLAKEGVAGSNPVSRSSSGKTNIAAFFLILFSLFSFYCSKPSGEGIAQHITFALKEPLESLDPIYAVDESSGIILSFLYRRLYKTSLEGRIVPDLVASENLHEGSVSLTLKKDSHKDRYGEYALHASDIQKSLMRLKTSGAQSWLTENFSDIVVTGPYSLRIQLSLKPGISSAALWQKQKSLLTLAQASVYDYEFFLKKHMFRSPSYFTLLENSANRVTLRAQNHKLIFYIIHDDSSRWFYFKRNLLDYYVARGIFRFGSYDKSKYDFISRPQLLVLYGAIVASSDGSGPLGNLEFRRALNYRIDRENLTERTLLGAYEAADYPVPWRLAQKLDVYYNYQPDYPVPRIEQQKDIIIYTLSDRERQLTARYLMSVILKMGYRARLKVVDLATLIRLNNSRLPGIYLFKWLADYPHAENFLIPLFDSKNAGAGGNRSYFANDRLDTIFRTKVLNREEAVLAQNIIRKEAPWVFIGFSKQFIFINKEKNIHPPAIYTGWSKRSFGWN